MNIHNDYKLLESETHKMLNQLQNLQSIRKGLASEIDKLYQSGFRDNKFEELKRAVEKNSSELQKAEIYFQRCADELTARASLIKEYYAVGL
jgi:hypothetical protein